MSRRPQNTLWPAPPHTLAKIAILHNYMRVWFEVLGRSAYGGGQDLVYIDGFAGPGEYTNHPSGSPIDVLQAAVNAREKVGTQWLAGRIHCVFIEEDKGRFLHLQHRLQDYRNHSYIQIHCFNSRFDSAILDIRKRFPHFFSDTCSLFAFIDPFGATGMPFTLVEELLRTPRTEVFVNLDTDGIARNFRADNPGRDKLFGEIFGTDDWERIQTGISLRDQGLEILNLYKQKLRSIGGVDYVFSFEMSSTPTSTDYFLVFASRHYKGLEKMKEAMKSMDQDGTYRFCDTGADQMMFNFNDASDFALKMSRHFVSQEVTYDRLRDYALNETPFINPKQILKILEQNHFIEVIATNDRRPLSYNEKKIRFIRFLDKEEPFSLD